MKDWMGGQIAYMEYMAYGYKIAWKPEEATWEMYENGRIILKLVVKN
jgi:hypothetical protein